ncbi:hypothetical protein [Portibacter marinus]|uniref:hypothetical protein n=1 Tax=Portibacter marinus TaxID=2898660 RepID=UPI001F182773|nr:hypothetical protein [Portibacter marinus]
MKNIIQTLRTNSPFLYGCIIFILLLAVISVAGLILDERTLKGVNVWIKPLKFNISTAIYMSTVGFLITFYPYSRLKTRLINGVVAWTLLIEMIIINLQAARGVHSHYNVSNPFDGILFGMMGILIGVNVIIMLLLFMDAIRLRLKLELMLQIAIVLGWIVVIGGSWVGGQMIGQMAHNVGVPDGGQGIPLLNWSTIAGDLRVAHFFGLHGIQVIPLFALWVSNSWNVKKLAKFMAVVIFGLLYASWIAFTFYQAKQGLPLIALS